MRAAGRFALAIAVLGLGASCGDNKAAPARDQSPFAAWVVDVVTHHTDDDTETMTVDFALADREDENEFSEIAY